MTRSVCTVVLAMIFLATGSSRASVRETKSNSDTIFKELAAGLPTDGQRAKSARLELERWHKRLSIRGSATRLPLKTKDQKDAEVVVLETPAMGMPGFDFSMAFLVVDKQVIDWSSCWTHNRIANQEVLLQDLDGDGVSELTFQASEGWFGLKDKRQHSLPGDKRRFLYAYRVTSKGFQSLFPNTERNLNPKIFYDPSNQPVVLQVTGLPESIRERQMVECTLTVKNQANHAIAVTPNRWFTVSIDHSGCSWQAHRLDNYTSLRPGQSLSTVVHLYVDEGTDKCIPMHWKFIAD